MCLSFESKSTRKCCSKRSKQVRISRFMKFIPLNIYTTYIILEAKTAYILFRKCSGVNVKVDRNTTSTVTKYNYFVLLKKNLVTTFG